MECLVTVTSTPLHDASVCISCGVPATVRGLDKAHVQSRARRPDLKEAADNQVLMCRRCHDAMDREHKFRLVIEDGFCVKQEWSDEVADFADVRRVRVVVDKKRGHLVEDDSVLSAAAEDVSYARETVSQTTSAAAPSAENKEESDGQTPSFSHSGDDGPDRVRSGTSGERTSTSLLTHEERVAIAQHIRDAQQRRQFLAGDTANLWEEELNEDFWNLYANEFGYTYPSLRNVMRVCKSIPPDQRHDEMSFAHHEAVKTFDMETREAWLERAFDEEWPVKRLREELVAEGLLTAKPRVKRWSMEELSDLSVEYSEADNLPKHNPGTIGGFLDWLGER